MERLTREQNAVVLMGLARAAAFFQNGSTLGTGAILRDYHEAIESLELDSEGVSLPVEDWFNKHWFVFYLKREWAALNAVEKCYVEHAHKLCQQMTIVQ